MGDPLRVSVTALDPLLAAGARSTLSDREDLRCHGGQKRMAPDSGDPHRGGSSMGELARMGIVALDRVIEICMCLSPDGDGARRGA